MLTRNVLLLQAYAIVLALFQSLHGVLTDEAKYLLNIPYPHPPLVRTLLSATENCPYQELLWRIIFASLLIHAVWFVYDMARHMHKEKRFVLCGFWLLSASVVLQAGSIMMAPLTAFQALVFLWLYIKQNQGHQFTRSQAGWIALFWMASLFSAYQIVLYLPLVIILFWKMRIHQGLKICGVGVPLILLTLYTLTNPLIPMSMISAGTQNEVLGFFGALTQTGIHWVIGGSLVLSTLGTIGMVRGKDWPVLLSLLLVLFYVSLSSRTYYEVLFMPLFIGGVIAYPQLLRKADALFACFIVASAYLVFQNLPTMNDSDAKRVISQLDMNRGGEYLLISGSFGHQWQYESPKPVRRFTTHLLDQAAYVVCLDSCSDLAHFGWRQVENLAPEVWFQKESPGPIR